MSLLQSYILVSTRRLNIVSIEDDLCRFGCDGPANKLLPSPAICWRNRFDVAGSVLDEYCRVEKVAFAWAWPVPVFLGATPLLFAMKMLSLFRGNKSSNSRDDIVPDDIEPKNDEKLFDKEEEDSCCFVIVR